MDNHGKRWSIDDDQKLMETPMLPDAHFAQYMGRTENAIRCRRNHLAAKMHQNDPISAPLDECVRLMQADYAQASLLLQEWAAKRASMSQFLDANRKRKQPSPSAPVFPVDTGNGAEGQRITYICKRICDEGGNMASLWTVPHLLPCLVQHYPGFEAYARVCQILVAAQ
jgi:hypothetical protein